MIKSCAVERASQKIWSHAVSLYISVKFSEGLLITYICIRKEQAILEFDINYLPYTMTIDAVCDSETKWEFLNQIDLYDIKY